MIRQIRTIFLLSMITMSLFIGTTRADNVVNDIGVTGNSSSQPACALLETMLGGAGIQLQNFNLAEQSFNLSEQSFNLSEQSFNLSEQSFNLAEQGFNLAEQNFNVADQSFNLSEQNFNVADQSFNLAEQSFNLAEQTFNLSEQGFTVSEQGFNLSEQGFNIAEQQFGTTPGSYLTFSWLQPLFPWNPKDASGNPINPKPSMVLMDYSDPINVAAEVAIHPAPSSWGADLVNHENMSSSQLYLTHKVAVIFVDVGSENDPNSHMAKVSGIFKSLNSVGAIPPDKLKLAYIDISNPSINYRVSTGGGYDGIEGALRQTIGQLPSGGNPGSGLLGEGYTNIVINMSLAFIPCADTITVETANGNQQVDWNIDDFIDKYNESNDPNAQQVKPVQPLAECVFADGKSWYARFGYDSDNINPVNYDANSNDNRFSPNPQYRDQPSIFEPGLHHGVVEIKFSKPSITWTIVGPDGVEHSATAYIPDNAPSGGVASPDTATPCLELDPSLNPQNAVVVQANDGTGQIPGSLLDPIYPVEPKLSCIRQDASGPVAVFSYYNWNDGFIDPGTGQLIRPARTVYIPGGGKNNKFSPNPGNRGQVTHFLPGEQPYVFEVPFKSSEQDMSWTLTSDWVTPDVMASNPNFDFPTTIVASLSDPNVPACAETTGGTDLGNYLEGFGNVPEGKTLNVLTYLVSTTTQDDTTDTSGLRDLLAQYLAGSVGPHSGYNIATVASSGNFRPWFSIMEGIPNIAFDGNGNVTFLDSPINPLAPARWPETIAVSASVGNDAWAIFDDDNENATIVNDTVYSRSIPDNNDGTLYPWEDNLDPQTEDQYFNWKRWFFSHDGDIMVRGAGYRIVDPSGVPHSIAGTSFSSPGAAYVLAQYFTFPDACTFPTVGAKAYPPLRDLLVDPWQNHVLEGYLDKTVQGTSLEMPLYCNVQNGPYAQDDSFTTAEDTELTGNVLDNDYPNGGTITPTTFSTGTGATVELNADGSFTYMPFKDYNGTDSFQYTITDAGSGLSDTATVTITVTPVNDAPVANPDSYPLGGADPIKEDVPFLISGANGVLANDTDVDTPHANLTASPTGVRLTEKGNWVTLNSDGSFYYTSEGGNVNFNGVDSFTYTVCDNDPIDPKCDTTGKVTLNISPVNDPPVAVDDTASTNDKTAVTINVLANDTDVENDTLTVTGVGTPHIAGTSTSFGSVKVNADNTITFTPVENVLTTDTDVEFTYTISDGNGGTDTATVTVTVSPVNDPPVCGVTTSTPDDHLWPVNKSLVLVDFSMSATDIEGDPVTVSISSIYQDEPVSHKDSFDAQIVSPTSAYLRADRDGNGDGRIYYVTITADDGHGGTCTGNVLIGVLHDARPYGEAIGGGPLYDSTKPSN